MPVRSDLPPDFRRFPVDDSGEMPVDRDSPIGAPVRSEPLPPRLNIGDGSLSHPDGNTVDHFERDTNAPRTTEPTGAPAPVSSRSVEGNRDSASYSDGRNHYSWDLRSSADGDRSGTVEGGTRLGETDVSVRTELNETTGEMGHELRAGRNLGDSGRIDGSVARDERGDLSLGLRGEAELGADTHGYADLRLGEGENPSLRAGVEHEGRHGTLGGHINVDDGEFRSATVEARHEGRHVNVEGAVDVDRDGNLSGELSASSEHTSNDGRTSVRGNLRTEFRDGDLDVSGDGRIDHRVNDHVAVSEHVRVENGEARFEHGVRYTDARNSANLTMEHGVEGDGSLRGDFRRGETSASFNLEGDVHGIEAGRLSGEHRFTGGHRLGGDVELDEDGVRSGTLRAEIDTGRGVRLSENVSVDREGNYRAEHRVSTVGGQGYSGSASLSHGNSEHTRMSAEVRRDLADGFTSVSGDFVPAEGSGRIRAEHEEGDFGVDGSVSRERGGRYDVNVNSRYETDHGRVSGGAGYRSGEGVSLRADGSRNFGETNVNAGVDANFGRETYSGNLGANRSILDGRATVAGAGRARVDKSGTEVGLNVSSTLSRFLGQGALTPKLDASLRSEKLKLAGHSSLDRGVRRQIMDANPGTVFVTGAVEGRFSGGISARVPVGPGSVEGGYIGSKSHRVEVTRRAQEPNLGQLTKPEDVVVPMTADGLVSFAAGEGFKITGKGSHAFRAGARVGRDIDLGGSVTASNSAGVHLDYALRGQTTTEVIKGNNGTAMISITASDVIERGGGLDVKIGVSPDVSEILEREAGVDMDAAGPVGSLAANLARDAITRTATIGIDVSRTNAEEERKLFSARLDLKLPQVRQAYDAALAGDWRLLNDLDAEGHPGVEIEKSVVSDIDKEVRPFVLSGLGLRYENSTSTTEKVSNVVAGTERATVTSVSDVSRRHSQNWFDDTRISVEDFARDIKVDGSDDIETQQWLVWTFRHEDPFKSSDEVSRDLGLVEYLGGPNPELDTYRSKVRALPEHRKLWLGPRNELRKTAVETRVQIDKQGLANLKNLEVEELWTQILELADIASTNHHIIGYFDAETRADYRDGFVHWGVDDYAYMTFLRYEQALKSLSKASRIEALDERVDAMREGLASIDDPVVMAALVDKIGRSDIKVEVNVDSNAQGGATLDFRSSISGTGFESRSRLYGLDL